MFGWLRSTLLDSETSQNSLTESTKPVENSTTVENQTLNENWGGLGAIGSMGVNMNPVYGTMDPTAGFQGSFIGDSFYDTGGVFGNSFNNNGILDIEKAYIMQQRTISLYPEVAIGIEEIMRDLFVKDDPFKLSTDSDENFDQIKEIFDKFAEKPFTVLSNFNKTPNSLIIFNFFKQAYIDGRIAVLSLKVSEDQLKQGNLFTKDQTLRNMHGMKGTILNESLVHFRQPIFLDATKLDEEDIVKLLESENKPKNRKSRRKTNNAENQANLETSDNDKNKVRVFIPIDPIKIQEQQGKVFYVPGRLNKVELTNEQLIQSDFGLFDVVGARHGFLLYAFKYANQLQALQDMLIPMRFRRSVARRVFNVDISNMPQNRAISYMQDLQAKFKYKKHYDATTGKIVSKTNEPTGIVEDYWFANRSGGKGTSVETIDEAGNFQDSLDDIMYFNKKLYQSMFIPLRRIFESDASYDYTANSIEVDELRFVNFLDRVRFVYSTVLTDMFRLLLKDAGIEEDIIKEAFIELNYDAWYEKAKVKEDFEKALDLYETAKPYIGKLFSAETIIQKIFNLQPNDIMDEFEKIKQEIEQDSPFYPIYQANDQEDDGY